MPLTTSCITHQTIICSIQKKTQFFSTITTKIITFPAVKTCTNKQKTLIIYHQAVFCLLLMTKLGEPGPRRSERRPGNRRRLYTITFRKSSFSEIFTSQTGTRKTTLYCRFLETFPVGRFAAYCAFKTFTLSVKSYRPYRCYLVL